MSILYICVCNLHWETNAAFLMRLRAHFWTSLFTGELFFLAAAIIITLREVDPNLICWWGYPKIESVLRYKFLSWSRLWTVRYHNAVSVLCSQVVPLPGRSLPPPGWSTTWSSGSGRSSFRLSWCTTLTTPWHRARTASGVAETRRTFLITQQ